MKDQEGGIWCGQERSQSRNGCNMECELEQQEMGGERESRGQSIQSWVCHSKELRLDLGAVGSHWLILRVL